MTPHERYEQLWRELALCDQVGFDYAFCVEHHFRPDESWMSSARPRAGHQPGLFPSVRSRLCGAKIADAGIHQLLARTLRRQAAILVPRRRLSHSIRRACGAAASTAASAALDDEPRSANARILRAQRHLSGLFPGLSARRRGAAVPSVFGGLESRRLAAKAEHCLQHGVLCGRERCPGARDRRVPGKPRVRRILVAAEAR